MKSCQLSAVVFFAAVAAVFIGDVHIPQTVPLSVLIALLFVFRLPEVRISRPLIFLAVVMLSGFMNLVLSGSYDAERDFVIYLPVVYALFILLMAGGFEYDEKLHDAFVAGGVVLCCWVFWEFAFVADNPVHYYQLKLTAETPLGRSNYLAAFLGFLLLVSTFRARWLLVLVVPAFVLTLSRTGMVLVVAFVLLRFMLVRRYALPTVMVALVAGGLAYHFAERIYQLPDIVQEGLLGSESLTIRVSAWLATMDIARDNLLFGIPRGAYRDALESAVPGQNLWDPHNSILHVLVSFGLVGLLFYLAYVVTIWGEIYRASRSSRFWRGACWGYSLILVWSLFEPLLLTPAIELLQAYLFIMAREFNHAEPVAGQAGEYVVVAAPGETR
jgi:O-antigen ligase